MPPMFKNIDFHNEKHCNIIIKLAERNDFHIDDLKLQILQEPPQLLKMMLKSKE